MKYLLILLSVVIIALFIIFFMNREKFTNESGFMCQNCETKTLKDCLSCTNCGYCMKNSTGGYDSKCVPIKANGKPVNPNEQCDKIYSNNEFSRAMLSNDSDYKKYESLPMFE